MQNRLETIVGLLVFVLLVGVGWTTVKMTRQELFGEKDYTLTARFDSVAGLREGSNVEMAGVRIGQVENIRLDHEDMIAVVTLKIREHVLITDDSIASVKTSGLIGDKYINISPGGSPDFINPGGVIVDTESALDIEGLVSKYAFGSVEK